MANPTIKSDTKWENFLNCFFHVRAAIFTLATLKAGMDDKGFTVAYTDGSCTKREIQWPQCESSWIFFPFNQSHSK